VEVIIVDAETSVPVSSGKVASLDASDCLMYDTVTTV
jgi:hypothetical protein